MEIGAWKINPSVNTEINAVSEEDMAIFNQAMENLTGVNYTALIHAGQQLVNGINHLYIAQGKSITPGSETITLNKVIINRPLQGAPVIVSIENI